MDFLFGDKPLMEKVFKDMQPSLARLVLEWSFTFPLSPSDCLNEIAIFFAQRFFCKSVQLNLNEINSTVHYRFIWMAHSELLITNIEAVDIF